MSKISKVIFLLLNLLIFLIISQTVLAQGSSFVTIVNPVRGDDFWDMEEKPIEAVKGEMTVLQDKQLPVTWLIRFDALVDQEIIQTLQSSQNQEKGLLLEITPTLTTAANVQYNQSANWHSAGSIFLTGYSQMDRQKLIDSAFAKFKDIFGYYPKSVGAWYVDSYSLSYMQQKYKIVSALIVTDQYTTDNYQIWGQYWSTPYYPSKKNTLIPAQTSEDKLPIVVTQWAARDPINGYGDGVQESTYSLQANDYLDYHDLNIDYFSKLIDLFTRQKFNQFNQLVVGLENSYSWKKYQSEYQKQINILSDKQISGQLKILNMQDFADWYQKQFIDLSPEQIIFSKDPLGTEKASVWFMNTYYRAGWFYNQDGSVFRDVRPYVSGREEFCYSNACNQLNFATFALNVLDEVTNKQKLIIDQGRIREIQLNKENDQYVLSYLNEANNKREIIFMPRDIGIDQNIYAIDGLILKAISQSNQQKQIEYSSEKASQYQESFLNLGFQLGKFLIFIIFGLFIPGFLLVRSLREQSLLLNIFLSVCTGFVMLTLIGYFSGLLKNQWFIYIYLIMTAVIFIFKKSYQELNFSKSVGFNKSNLVLMILILSGTFFQTLSMIRSGWVYDFGIGFWGPTGHDGIWHQALISQLIKEIPPINPGFAPKVLSNYHYFYDLLVAVTFQLSQIPILDLLYRFYPILFSVLLGLGSYFLMMKLTDNKIAAMVSLYFVYFAGSFGWIVEYLREKHWGGESAFWVNQPVSMNLNPPFAISLLLVITIILIMILSKKHLHFISATILILLVGTLIEFKVYAGIIVLIGLSLVGLGQIILRRNFTYLGIFIISFLLSLGIFLPQNSQAKDLLIFSPFWFIHSMIDFPDRVGWLRMSMARQAYFERGDWFKYLQAEGLGLLIFIIGNLGIRFIGLFSIIVFFKRKLWQSPEYLLIFGMSATSLLIPILFIQKGNPWNTIQFFYYFLYFMSLATGIILVYLYKKLPKVIIGPILIIILLLAPINAVTTFISGFYSLPPARLTIGELEGLEFLKQLPEGTVLTTPFDKNMRTNATNPYPLFLYETTAYVAAFSTKAVFLEDEIQQEILQNDYQKRLVQINDFFNGQDVNWSTDFLKNNKIRYIYLPKIKQYSFDRSNLRSVFNNNEVEIFERINL